MRGFDAERLPNSLKEMVDIIGLEAVEKLVLAYGGTRLTVPKTMHEGHRLAKLLGLEFAQRLSENYALERFDVPTANVATKAIRNRRIRELNRRDKVSVRLLARQFDLSERQVWSILAEGSPR